MIFKIKLYSYNSVGFLLYLMGLMHGITAEQAIQLFCTGGPVNESLRLSSVPYISGDTFREFSNIVLDETNSVFEPSKLKDGDILFVKADLIHDFFTKCHPAITKKYILITHNSDCLLTIRSIEKYVLDDKLIAWFGTNTDSLAAQSPKVNCIPIGLENRHWNTSNTQILERAQKAARECGSKDHLLYLNITINTYPDERQHVYNLFADKPYCYTQNTKKSYYDYLLDLGKSKFVLSPRGNGIDCLRTWEALYMGSYPIVKSSSLDQVYAGLPVVIVQDWSEVTEEFLNQKYDEMQNKTYKLERLSIYYWFNKIMKYKARL